MSNNQSPYYTRYQLKHRARFSEPAQTYWENSRDEIKAHQRNNHRKSMKLSRPYSQKKYLGETLSNVIPPLSIGTFSEKPMNCVLLSFLAKHG